jgi:hypothetical protein
LQGPNWEDPVSALYGKYTVALQELKTLLKAHTPAGQSKTTEEDGSKEVRRRKRHSSNESAPTIKKAVPTADSAAVNTTSKTVPTRNFFAPLRASSMDTDSSGTEANPQKEETPG